MACRRTGSSDGDYDIGPVRCTVVQRWFAYIQRELERFIQEDPFEDIVTMLGNGTPFAFSRFGDGEFSAIFGVGEVNCDGHAYYPDLGQRLRAIVEGNPGYLMGLQPLAVVYHGALQIWQVAGDRKWVLADSLHLASVESRLGELFGALSRRNVLLVGPEHLGKLAAAQGWSHSPIPSRDCWTQYVETRERLKETISPSGDVVLFCASMMGNVLIDDLYTLKPTNTYIDAGSVLDPYAGVQTRAYHAQLSADAIARQARCGSGTEAAQHG
jgi:hypothetical protein